MQTSSIYIKEKWEKELKEQITEEEWFNICKTQCTATSFRFWSAFNWKNIVRFFLTPNIRKESVCNQQPCWRLYGHMDVAHMHIFRSCQKIIGYWDKIWWGTQIVCDTFDTRYNAKSG